MVARVAGATAGGMGGGRSGGGGDGGDGVAVAQWTDRNEREGVLCVLCVICLTEFVNRGPSDRVTPDRGQSVLSCPRMRGLYMGRDISLYSSTMTLTCGFGQNAYYGIFKYWLLSLGVMLTWSLRLVPACGRPIIHDMKNIYP